MHFSFSRITPGISSISSSGRFDDRLSPSTTTERVTDDERGKIVTDMMNEDKSEKEEENQLITLDYPLDDVDQFVEEERCVF
jgi:hypothetical protein